MKPKIIAHRGWSGRYPENTLISFEKALELPVDGIEFDLRLTADHEIVVSHNYDVDLRSNGSGVLADMTLAELKKQPLSMSQAFIKLSYDQTSQKLKNL